MRLPLAATLAVLSIGCVASPHDDEFIDPNAIDFIGYAPDPGQAIKVQILDKLTGAWIDIATTSASTSPTTLYGDTLYGWSINNVDTWPQTGCTWGDPFFGGGQVSCPIGAGSAQATFRVVADNNGTWTPLGTFGPGGLSCVTSQWASLGWIDAGSACLDADSPLLTLFVLT